MRVRGRSLLLVAMLVFVAGCGSSSSSSSSNSAAPGGNTTTSASGNTTTSSSNSGSGNFANSGNCAQLASVGQKFAQAMQSATTGGKYNLQAAVQAYQSLADNAPAEIRPDLEIIAKAFSQFAGALSKVGYKPGTPLTQSQIAQLQSALQVFNNPQIRAAAQRVAAWVQKNCGSLGKSGTTT